MHLLFLLIELAGVAKQAGGVSFFDGVINGADGQGDWALFVPTVVKMNSRANWCKSGLAGKKTPPCSQRLRRRDRLRKLYEPRARLPVRPEGLCRRRLDGTLPVSN